MANKEKKGFKILNLILTIVKVICIIFLILLIAVLALQRFSNNETAIGGFRIFNVATESMIPVYKVGDVILVKSVDTDTLEVGDDVTYLGKEGSFANRVVTHRIINIEDSNGTKIFHTQGVNNTAEDPTIQGDQIYGKVIHKLVVFTFISNLINNTTTFFIVIVVPLIILVFLQIKDSIDSKYEEDDDEEDEEDEDDSEADDEVEDTKEDKK